MVNKVFIFTEGGNNIGYGHITRCSSIYDELKSRKFDVTFFINGDNSIKKIIRNKKFKIIDWNNIEKLKAILKKYSFFSIVDSYISNKQTLDIIADSSVNTLFIDDNNRLEYKKGYVLNPSIFANQISYPANPKINYLLGNKYILLRNPFLTEEPKTISKNINKILITLGGTDILGLTPKILDLLTKNYPNIKKHVILNKNNKNISKIKRNYENTYLYHNLNAKQMKELMLKVDIAISAGGQTLYELAKVGTPTLAIEVAKNQHQNIEAFQNMNLILHSSIDTLVNDIQKLEDYNIRNRIHMKLKSIFESNGPKEIVNKFIGEQLKLREANPDDSKNLFILHNKNFSRKQSLNKNKISRKSHKKWYNDEIKNPNNKLFIIEDSTSVFLGYIRFDRKENEYIVSISLSNKLRGRGFSRYILSTAIKKLKSNMDEVKIVAYILSSNIASVKLFDSMKFMLIEKNNGIFKYVFKG